MGFTWVEVYRDLHVVLTSFLVLNVKNSGEVYHITKGWKDKEKKVSRLIPNMMESDN